MVSKKKKKKSNGLTQKEWKAKYCNYEQDAHMRNEKIKNRAEQIRQSEYFKGIIRCLYEDVYIRRLNLDNCLKAFEEKYGVEKKQLRKELSLFAYCFECLEKRENIQCREDLLIAVTSYFNKYIKIMEGSPYYIKNDNYFNIYELTFLIDCTLNILNKKKDCDDIVVETTRTIIKKSQQFRIKTHKGLYNESNIKLTIALISSLLKVENIDTNGINKRLVSAILLYKENRSDYALFLSMYNESNRRVIEAKWIEYQELKTGERFLSESITLSKQSKSNVSKTSSKYDQLLNFNKRRNALYIHRGNIICLKSKHNVENVRAFVNTIDNKRADININYCKTCDKYFMSLSEYEHYMIMYRFLPIRFKMVNSNGDFCSMDRIRSDTSPLKLCGYNVSQKDGFSQEYRHKMLANIISNEILSKREVMNYLDLFIHTNGLKYDMENAVDKWENDLEFVRSYNFNNQRVVTIDEIKPY